MTRRVNGFLIFPNGRSERRIGSWPPPFFFHWFTKEHSSGLIKNISHVLRFEFCWLFIVWFIRRKEILTVHILKILNLLLSWEFYFTNFKRFWTSNAGWFLILSIIKVNNLIFIQINFNKSIFFINFNNLKVKICVHIA